MHMQSILSFQGTQQNSGEMRKAFQSRLAIGQLPRVNQLTEGQSVFSNMACKWFIFLSVLLLQAQFGFSLS